jgi:hypothetical protein
MIRNGKIARLPREIRDELNRRMQDAEAGDTLLPWLNARPEVQSVLARQFGGCAINKQNLSEWRAGGFAEWQTRQEMLADARELAADAAELETATEGRLTDHLATVLGARYASALAGWDGQPTEEIRNKLKVLRGMCQDIVELRRGDHSGARLKMERDRLEEKREKTEEEVVQQFEEWAKIPAVHDFLCQTWVTPRERERRKREIFGRPPLPEDEVTDESESASVADQQKEHKDRIREIFGMAPEEEATAPNPVPPGRTESDEIPANRANPPEEDSPEAPVEAAPADPGSNPVKPSQTAFGPNQPPEDESGPVEPQPPHFRNGHTVAGIRYKDDT